jgi:hypothetical protein
MSTKGGVGKLARKLKRGLDDHAERIAAFADENAKKLQSIGAPKPLTAEEKAAKALLATAEEREALASATLVADRKLQVQRIVMRVGVDGFMSRPCVLAAACYDGSPHALRLVAKYATVAEELVSYNSGRVNGWPMRVIDTMVRNHATDFYDAQGVGGTAPFILRNGESKSGLTMGASRRSRARASSSSPHRSARTSFRGVRRARCAAAAHMHNANPPPPHRADTNHVIYSINGLLWVAWTDNMMSIPGAERMLKACAAKLQEIETSEILQRGHEAIAQAVEIFDVPDIYTREEIVTIVADLSASTSSMSATDLAIRDRGKAAELQEREDSLSDLMCAATHGETCARTCSASKRRHMGLTFAILVAVVGVVGIAAGIAVLCITKPWAGGAAAPSATNIAKEFVDLAQAAALAGVPATVEAL